MWNLEANPSKGFCLQCILPKDSFSSLFSRHVTVFKTTVKLPVSGRFYVCDQNFYDD